MLGEAEAHGQSPFGKASSHHFRNYIQSKWYKSNLAECQIINRRVYTLQSNRPHPERGRHYYYRPKDRKTGLGLSLTENARVFAEVVPCHCFLSWSGCKGSGWE